MPAELDRADTRVREEVLREITLLAVLVVGVAQVPAGDLDAEALLLALSVVFEPVHLIIDSIEERFPAVVFNMPVHRGPEGLVVGLGVVILPTVVRQDLLEGLLPEEGGLCNPDELIRPVLGAGRGPGRDVDVARGDGVRPQLKLLTDSVKYLADLTLPSPGHRHGRRDDLDTPC